MTNELKSKWKEKHIAIKELHDQKNDILHDICYSYTTQCDFKCKQCYIKANEV